MWTLRRTLAQIVAVCVTTAVIGVAPALGVMGPSIVTETFGYTGTTATFTVPEGITQLTLSMKGAEGGQGGGDSAGRPPPGGYQGVVSGTILVTPGQVLTIAVGQGGANGSSGAGSNDPGNYTAGAAVGGSNPLAGYLGGDGGVAGPNGGSGFGAAGGAATVVTTGGASIVAGGGGGSGGSGQYAPTLGRLSPSTFTARSDTVSTSGQTGITVVTACNNEPPTGWCDGGGSGGGGGGTIGGAQGAIEFGSGSSTEWFGYGGSVGGNSTAAVAGLTSSYQYYGGNEGDGELTISYGAGVPGAPTAVNGTPGDTSVALTWSAPAAPGASAVTDYLVEQALSSAPTDWTTIERDPSLSTALTVTGLTNGAGYIFRVSAENATGQGAAATSDPVTPVAPPTAPTDLVVTPADGALSVAFTAAGSGSSILDYEYQVGTGSWVSSGWRESPVPIAGLVNGTAYTVRIRAVNAVGAGAESLPVQGTPAANAGAPSITSMSTGVRSATVTFTPGYAGGGVITGYEYQLDGTEEWLPAGTASSPLVITNLADDMSYAIAIRAVTSAGHGNASPYSTVRTPGLPGAPDDVAVTAYDSALSIAFSAGVTGGTPITGYQYQLSDAGDVWTAVPSSASPIVVSGLENGTPYDVRLRAVNAVGPGAGSIAEPATPVAVPGAPTIVGDTVAGSDLRLSAAFTAPASDGGTPITTYEYSTDAGATWRARDGGGPATASPLVISRLSSEDSPLVNGITYPVEVRAVNSVGAGAASNLALGIPRTVPAAPMISGLAAGPSSLRVTFTPGSNGGDAITGYEYKLGTSTWVDTGTLGSTFLISGLTNGTAYDVAVRAVNPQGNGAASTVVSAIPVTLPGQANITGVVRADRTLTVSVAAADGGSPIFRWEYSTDGGTTWRQAGATATPLTITTLSGDAMSEIVNGSAYPVTVRAVSTVGTGAASTIMTAGPGAAPSAPAVTLTPLDQSIRVDFTVPDDGGAPISAVYYRLGETWINAGTLSSPFTIGSLVNGTEYSVAVRADNAIGNGAVSIPAATTPATVADAPTSVVALSNTASADVSWTAPASNGGAAITKYVITATRISASVVVVECGVAVTSCSVGGLTNSLEYLVTVAAVNAAGSSVASSPAVPVTPQARPGQPTGLSVVAGDAFLRLSFIPGSDGSAEIAGYDYQLDGGAWQPATATSTPVTVSGLTNGTSYAVALRARSAAGPGVPSAAVSATPYTYPDAPDPATIVAGGADGGVTVAWSAPADNGSPITGYTATAFSAATAGIQSGTCSTADALACTIVGLANDTTYFIGMQAGNVAGLSARSMPRVAVVAGPVTVATTSLAPAAFGVAYNALLATDRGTGPFVWSLDLGSLPAGLTLSPSGAITGTPSAAGPSAFTVRVDDSAEATDTAPLTLDVAATVPASPGIGSATGGDGQAVVTFTAPANGGGSPITGYTVTALDTTEAERGGQTATISGSAPGPVTVTGLTNGDHYTFRVTATNDVGTGPASEPSNPVTPAVPAPDPIPDPDPDPPAPVPPPVTVVVPAPLSSGPMAATPDGNGYWTATPTGTVHAYGDATSYGSLTRTLNRPIVGIVSTLDGHGYWLVADDGGIFAFGNATYLGSTGALTLNQPIAGMAATPDDGGYWLVAQDGGIFAFGNAAFHGSTGAMILKEPISGMARTPDGNGYWLVARDGGIFAFGSASFSGSTGDRTLNRPIVGMDASPDGGGYWIVADDGGVFAFGSATYLGSTGALTLNQPIAGMAATPDGDGYWLVARDGGVFAFGGAAFYGSTGGLLPGRQA